MSPPTDDSELERLMREWEARKQRLFALPEGGSFFEAIYAAPAPTDETVAAVEKFWDAVRREGPPNAWFAQTPAEMVADITDRGYLTPREAVHALAGLEWLVAASDEAVGREDETPPWDDA